MWLVRMALRRPYSVATFCIAMVLLGVLSMRNMLTDVLPAIDIPVVIVVYNYPGLSAADVQNRMLLVAQMTLSSSTQSELEVFDYAQNFLRLRLFTIPGLQTPPPYGGSVKQVSIDIDPAKLAAKQLAPQDVVQAVLTSNVILPAGSA